MKPYSADLRERLMLELLDKRELTFKGQSLINDSHTFSAMMNNLTKPVTSWWKFNLATPLVKKVLHPNNKKRCVFILTVDGEHYAFFVKAIREVENANS